MSRWLVMSADTVMLAGALLDGRGAKMWPKSRRRAKSGACASDVRSSHCVGDIRSRRGADVPSLWATGCQRWTRLWPRGARSQALQSALASCTRSQWWRRVCWISQSALNACRQAKIPTVLGARLPVTRSHARSRLRSTTWGAGSGIDSASCGQAATHWPQWSQMSESRLKPSSSCVHAVRGQMSTQAWQLLCAMRWCTQRSAWTVRGACDGAAHASVRTSLDTA